ncbi:MAG: PHP domain-containing protein, partial [Tangfeifania sp.]
MYLNVHSWFSLRYGTRNIDQLLAGARQNNAEAFALTDINTTMGIPELVKKAPQAGVKPIAGVEVRNGDELLFIGIAKNNTGFKELNDYLTWHTLEKREFTIDEWPFSQVIVIFPFGKKMPRELKDYEYTGIKPGQLNRLVTSEYRNFQDKLLVWQPVTALNEKAWHLHKSLRAIDHNTLISKLIPGQFATSDETMIRVAQLKEKFSAWPKIIQNTEKVMQECSISFDFKKVKNKQVFSQSKYDDRLLLEK